MEKDVHSAYSKEQGNDLHRQVVMAGNSSASASSMLFPLAMEGRSTSQSSRDETELLPESFQPGSKDIICGRQRENFHHEGNKYFRELIQKNIGPYIGSRTKLEKGDAIIRITKIVRDSSPTGGFVKKDEQSGRWYRIKDSEARDKVGHAIRKAVQRLEDTKPAKAARLRTEFASYATKAALEDSDSCMKPEMHDKKKANSKLDAKNSPGGKRKKEREAAAAPKQAELPSRLPGGTLKLNFANVPMFSDPYFSSTFGRSFGSSGSIPSLEQRLVAGQPASIFASLGLAHNQPTLLSQGFPGAAASNVLSPNYNHLLALRLQEQRSQDELALVRALQQQQEEKIRREIEYNSQRLLPLGNSADPVVNTLPWRMPTSSNALLLGQQLQLQQQVALNTAPAMSPFLDPTLLNSIIGAEVLKKQTKNEGRK